MTPSQVFGVLWLYDKLDDCLLGYLSQESVCYKKLANMHKLVHRMASIIPVCAHQMEGSSNKLFCTKVVLQKVSFFWETVLY